MLLKNLTIQNFRNYQGETFSFHPRFNLIVGENGQGKTNLLESVFFLANTRPFKPQKMEEIIRFGQSGARIKGEFETASGLNEVHIALNPGGKTTKLNGKVVYDQRKIVGRFNTVAFLPDDIEIVKGSPGERRRYLDSLIVNIDPEHLRDSRQYAKAIAQRNQTLQRSRDYNETLKIWDEQIAKFGARIIVRRLELISKIEPLIEKRYRSISNQDQSIRFKYGESFSVDEDIENAMKSALEDGFDADVKLGHTSVGPHRDQPELLLGGNTASKFASQGEAKTLSIALRIAEITLIKSALDALPILLIDDLTSELDRNRRRFVFKLLNDYPGQIFITSTSIDDIEYEGDKKTFGIRDGAAKIISSE